MREKLKNIKDRMGELSGAEKKTACESMADNASIQGANS